MPQVQVHLTFLPDLEKEQTNEQEEVIYVIMCLLCMCFFRPRKFLFSHSSQIWAATKPQVGSGAAAHLMDWVDWAIEQQNIVFGWLNLHIQTTSSKCLDACMFAPSISICAGKMLMLALAQPASIDTPKKTAWPEPGSEPLVLPEPDSTGCAGHQTKSHCIWRAWMTHMQASKQALAYTHRFCLTQTVRSQITNCTSKD